MTVDEIHEITKIDEWFLWKLEKICKMEEKTVVKVPGSVKGNETTVGNNLIYPPRSFKMVDTCAGEFDAETPYFYSTTGGENEAELFLEENRN